MERPHTHRFDVSQAGIPGLIAFEFCEIGPDASIAETTVQPETVCILLLIRGRIVFRSSSQSYRLVSLDHFVIFPDDGDVKGEVLEFSRFYRLILNLRRLRTGFLGLDARGAGVLSQALEALPSRHFRCIAGAEQELRSARSILSEQLTPLRRIAASEVLVRFALGVIEGADMRARDRITPAMTDLASWLRKLPDPEWVSVPQMARQAGLSVPWFQARFRQELGVPPAEYWLRMKLERACKRLRGGTHSVARIAASLGFASSAYFATTFRRYTNQTPMEYRSDPKRRAHSREAKR